MPLPRIPRVLPPLAALAIAALGLAACTDAPAGPLPGASLGEVPHFGLYDHTGEFRTLSYYSDAPAVVLYVQGNGCPIVRNAAPALQAVREAYEARGVVFLMLNANLQDSREEIADEVAAFGYGLPVLKDEAQVVAEALGVRRTAEAIVIDPRRRQIVFRGPVDDRVGYETQREAATATYLADALEAHLGGEAPAPAEVPTKGCLVTLRPPEASGDSVTYVGDIAPLLAARCRHCHQPGGVAPWAMTDYETVRGWSAMIGEVVLTNRMPPWQADPHVGAFRDDPTLSPEEVRRVAAWVAAGAPRGEGEDPLAADPAEPPAEWPLGPPDVVLRVPPQAIPATGVVDYRYPEVDPGLGRDVWLQAVDIQPGDRAVLHHALASLNQPPGAQVQKRGRSKWLDNMLTSYAPGVAPEPFPDGSARLLRAGTTIAFQLHYTAVGRPAVDSIRVGLYLADGPQPQEHVILAPRPRRLRVPAGRADYRASADVVLDAPAVLHSLRPHMHYRGRSVRYVLHYPDGTSEDLLSVPRYTFNWQTRYVLTEPKPLPAGTRIACHARFDNSARNPLNPSPGEEAAWGRQIDDEMLVCYAEITRPRAQLVAAR